MLANYKIESSNYILRIASKDKGRLLLQNKQSETLVQLGELKLGRWPQLELENNCKYEIIEVDEASAIRINYFFSPSVPTSMKLTGTFIVHQDRVDVQYLLSGVPEKYKADWIRMSVPFLPARKRRYSKTSGSQIGDMAAGY